MVLGPCLGWGNESKFYPVQTALYLPPNNHETFSGVAIVRMVGMAMQILAWSTEGGIERSERWERGHVYDAKDKLSYSLTNLCLSAKCHSMASHHLKPCSTSHAKWSVWPFITFCSILCSIFAKGVSKLGYVGQALVETYGARIFLESNSVISIQNQIAQKWQWLKQCLVDKRCPTQKKRNTKKKKKSHSLKCRRVKYDLTLFFQMRLRH